MQNGHGRESGGCVELGLSKEKCSVQLFIGSRCLAGGRRLSWMPLKVLLYDDLVGVVSSHVTKMVVTPLDTPWRIPQLYSNFTALSSIRPKLLPITVFHWHTPTVSHILQK